MSEIAAIKNMKNNKSQGINDIPSELLKATGESGEKIIPKIFNQV